VELGPAPQPPHPACCWTARTGTRCRRGHCPAAGRRGGCRRGRTPGAAGRRARRASTTRRGRRTPPASAPARRGR
jgi:hypothetical protein